MMDWIKESFDLDEEKLSWCLRANELGLKKTKLKREMGPDITKGLYSPSDILLFHVLNYLYEYKEFEYHYRDGFTVVGELPG